ncbi:cyanocobalamin reductase / alkylcobalamin dealkylase-like [Ptychodera flava]|uniref:cyanocobalamin reductase / alkylcobalamin dealkylase-like n=1 Tax=Ptychodera flava TaxID=63121 RepID=UPI00396A4C2D
MASSDNVRKIDEAFDNIFTTTGFEFHKFKIGWYNDCVDTPFKLDCPSDTLAYLTISTPNMFEKSFLPYITRVDCLDARDPIDQCVDTELQKVKEALPDQEIEIIHDYDLHPNRRPKVLVQTAGHVAGSAFYYQRKHMQKDPWDKDKNIFGVSIHPKYGGWFAFRGVVIFKDIQVPDLEQKDPPDVLPTDELKQELLERFNDRWQDWSYRDIIPVEGKYSEQQKLYFGTAPKDRKQLLESMTKSHDA